jgi:hypothetical protein
MPVLFRSVVFRDLFFCSARRSCARVLRIDGKNQQRQSSFFNKQHLLSQIISYIHKDIAENREKKLGKESAL